MAIYKNQTLKHGNSKNEIRQRNRQRKYEWRVERSRQRVERSKAGTKNRSRDGLSLPSQNATIINIIW